jgi:hypothetical protein
MSASVSLWAVARKGAARKRADRTRWIRGGQRSPALPCGAMSRRFQTDRCSRNRRGWLVGCSRNSMTSENRRVRRDLPQVKGANAHTCTARDIPSLTAVRSRHVSCPSRNSPETCRRIGRSAEPLVISHLAKTWRSRTSAGQMSASPATLRSRRVRACHRRPFSLEIDTRPRVGGWSVGGGYFRPEPVGALEVRTASRSPEGGSSCPRSSSPPRSTMSRSG